MKSREYPAVVAHTPVALTLLVVSTALWLAGCWTPPNANTRPSGPPRIIASGVRVRSVTQPAIVQSVDTTSRTIVLKIPGTSEARAYHMEPGVSGLAQVSAGTRVCATATEEISVYVAPDGESPAPEARVRSIDRSYRLLGIQHAGGDVETFKVDPTVPLDRMQAGDSVRIAPVDLVSLSKCRHL